MSMTVPCKWCETPTTMTGTHECNNCWEIRRRTDISPSLVADAAALLHWLGELVNALPERRDWLDPVIEDNARALLRKHGRM